MKTATNKKITPRWSEKKVRAVIAYYDRQTDEEGAAEIETASEAPGETWMSVPTALVSAIARLIEEHEQKTSNARSRNKKKITPRR